MQRSEDLLLGKLAVREGICTQEQIDECLRIQAISRSTALLGDLLLFKGYLTTAQLKTLLSRQHKKVMACPSCGLSFTVLTLSEGKSVQCPKCKGTLVQTRPEGSTRTDAEFATGRLCIAPAPPGPKVKIACIICDTTFETVTDSSSRVRCPACQSTFTSPQSF